MDIHKKTIKQSIFFSHLIIILIYVVLTSIVFNICLRIYVRNQTKAQLVSVEELARKSVNNELFNIGTLSNTANENKQFIKSLLKVNRVLKQTQTFLDVNYAVIGKRDNLIYPSSDSNGEYDLLTKYIIPVIGKNKLTVKSSRNKIINFTTNGQKYIALLNPIKSANTNNVLYLLLYSNLNKMNKMLLAVNFILIGILLVTAGIALVISNKVSKKISDPITELGKYARSIGDRQFDAKAIKFDNDEIGQLAKIMSSMSNKLSIYDNTMKTFFQNASHELRTPLMSIQGYAEGIKYNVVDDKDSAVDIIIEESKRLSNLVEDLLYLSKIDSTQDKLNMELLNVEDIIRSSIERVNGIAVKSEKTIHFNCKIKDLTVKGDEEKLTRAIINILGNCLRYAKKNIEVIAEKENSKVVIWIKDDGCGIDKKDLANIFDRFYKGKNGNHGLGLAITKSIIERHHGIITAGNNGEGGAFFKIIL